jgi:hypothetical protein
MPAMTAAGSDSMGMCSSSGNGAAFPTPAASASNLVIYANFIFPKSTCASSGAGTGRGRKQQRPPISIPVTTASVILGGSDERNFKLGKSFPIPCWYPWLFGPESALVPIGKLDDDLCRYHALIGFNWQLKIFQIAALDNDYSISGLFCTDLPSTFIVNKRTIV